jgi:hypothetical protein
LTMIGEASTGGANCSHILSPSPWFCLIFIWLFDYVEDLGLLPKCGNQSQELSGVKASISNVKASISNVFGRAYELQYMGRANHEVELRIGEAFGSLMTPGCAWI